MYKKVFNNNNNILIYYKKYFFIIKIFLFIIKKIYIYLIIIIIIIIIIILQNNSKITIFMEVLISSLFSNIILTAFCVLQQPPKPSETPDSTLSSFIKLLDSNTHRLSDTKQKTKWIISADWVICILHLFCNNGPLSHFIALQWIESSIKEKLSVWFLSLCCMKQSGC